MALSGKSSVLLLRGQLWWRLKTIVLWQAAISTLASGSQQGQGHGSRFKCPPATSALWSTHPVLAFLGNSLYCAPHDAELRPGGCLTLPQTTWIFAGFPQDGKEKGVSVAVSCLATSSDTWEHRQPFLTKILHQDTLKAAPHLQLPPADRTGRLHERVHIVNPPLVLKRWVKLTQHRWEREEPPFTPVNSHKWTDYSRGTCTSAADCNGKIPSVRNTLVSRIPWPCFLPSERSKQPK